MWFFLACSSLLWMVVAHGQLLIFRGLRLQWRAAKDYRLQTLLGLTQLWTHLLWTGLPLVIALASSDVITADVEQWAFFGIDVGSKAVLCASLRAFVDRQQWLHAVAVRERETQYKLFAEDANRRKREFLRYLSFHSCSLSLFVFMSSMMYQLYSYVFHEVRVPLQAFALGVTDLLDSFQMATESQSKATDAISSAVQRPLGLHLSPRPGGGGTIKSAAATPVPGSSNTPNVGLKRRPESAKRRSLEAPLPGTVTTISAISPGGGGGGLAAVSPAGSSSINTSAASMTTTSSVAMLRRMPSLRDKAAIAAASAANASATSGTSMNSSPPHYRIDVDRDDNTNTAMGGMDSKRQPPIEGHPHMVPSSTTGTPVDSHDTTPLRGNSGTSSIVADSPLSAAITTPIVDRVPGLTLSTLVTQPATPASILTVTTATAINSHNTGVPAPTISPTSANATRPRSSHATTAVITNNTMGPAPTNSSSSSSATTIISVPMDDDLSSANNMGAQQLAMMRFMMEHPGFVADSLATINLLHDSTNYMSQILDDVLTSQKIEDGQFTLNKAPFNIQSLARSTVALMKTWLKDKGIKIVFDIDETIPTVFGDKYRIRQVIANFLSNALKFSHHGGAIEVIVQTLALPQVATPGSHVVSIQSPASPVAPAGGGHAIAPAPLPIGAPTTAPIITHVAGTSSIRKSAGGGSVGMPEPGSRSGNSRASKTGTPNNARHPTASPRQAQHAQQQLQQQVGGMDVGLGIQPAVYLRVGVRDHGVGMSDADQRDLFRPYYQVLGGAAQKGKGTGLGLSICKNIITLCGGEIGVKAKEGKGSFFYFDVPLPVVRDAEDEVTLS
jgi:signal transduction histidine kinase